MLLFYREKKRMGKIVAKSVDMNANILYLKHEIVADTSKTQAKIEFRSMAYGTINAVKFEAKGYNAFGDVIQIAGKTTFDIVAQDLVIAPKKYAKIESVLPSRDIRKLDLKLKQVCYANGRIVNTLPENNVTYQFESLDDRVALDQQEKQERVIIRRRLDEAICLSKRYGRNWICICGYLNKNTDAICKNCGCKEVEMLEEFSKEAVDERIETNRRKAEVLIGFIIWGVVWGYATKAVIKNKGYDDNWFWWGFFFGFIALIVAVAKPENRKQTQEWQPVQLQTNSANKIPEPKKEESPKVVFDSTVTRANTDYMANIELQLKDLDELLSKGYVTESEYQEKKKEIIGA